MACNPVRKASWMAATAAMTACALPATANTGIGILVSWIPIAVVAFIPVVVVEGAVLAAYLHVGYGRGMWLSLAANFVSTLVGAILGVGSFILPIPASGLSREWTLVSLVPMFFVSWWLEKVVVRRMEPPERKPRALRVTGVANAVSYALMAAGVALMLPAEEAIVSREKIVVAFNSLAAAQVAVDEHFAKNGTFPPPKRYDVKARNVRSLALEPGGKLVLVLSFPGSQEGDGKRIVYEPRVADGKIVQWTCTSDLRPGRLPMVCR